MTIQEKIKKLEEQGQKINTELHQIRAMLEKYPQLEVHVNRWGHEHYICEGINPQCTEVEIYHNCGCCEDSPLEAHPYIETPQGRIFSADVPIWIGEKYYNGGDMPSDNWREKLKDLNFTPEIWAQIQDYFNRHLPLLEEGDDEE